MKRLLFLCLTILFCKAVLAQAGIVITDTTRSGYKDLPVLKKYLLGYRISDNRVDAIKPNGEPLSKNDYDNYNSTSEAMAQCQPCILMCYDLNDNLLSRSVQYTDCTVGYTIDYYPNGKVKRIGHYKENPGGNWNDIAARGLCREDGIFTYFNKYGVRLYNEYWKDGQFIKQVPEQLQAEIWNIDCSLDGQPQNLVLTLTPSQLKRIKFTPKFKNQSREGVNIRIEVEITVDNHKTIKQTFTPENFNTIDVPQLLKEAGINSFDNGQGLIHIYNNEENLFNYYITLKPGR